MLLGDISNAAFVEQMWAIFVGSGMCGLSWVGVLAETEEVLLIVSQLSGQLP